MIALQENARIDTYRLIRPLGRGGFAEVWEAQNETDGRRVALKVLTELRADSERALERFEQEGRLTASLSSPRCVYVFGAGVFEGCPYIVMELMAGGTLSGRIESGPLPGREAVDCVLDVLDGLEAAQAKGILHRDVKPSNVFLGADGRAKIGDFGISKSLGADAKLSQTGAFLGTPYYASPEQIAAEPLDLRSDLYSVGAMLYEILTGKLPYLGTNPSAVLAQVLTREPVPFAQTGVSVPLGLQQIVMRLLAKQREKRFQTYEETRKALLPFSSRGLAVAPLSRRFGAIFIDIGLLFFPIGLLGGAFLVGNGFRKQTELALSLHFAQLVYFTLTEWIGGASVGKRLLGLRVTSVDGGSVRLPVVAARTLVFLILFAGPNVVFQELASRGVSFGSGVLAGLVPLLAGLMGLGVMMMSMRVRNGYAGAHDLLTRTRVMALVTRDRAAAVVGSQTLVPETGDPTSRSYGPYRGAGLLWSVGSAALEVARDEALQRDVWIHSVEGGKGLPPLDVLRERGAGSLPWLQRGTSGAVTWDAYGAPGGTSLVAAGATGLDWRQMRVLLGSLLAELQGRFKRQGSAGALGPGHIWIDPQGHAVVLDFPATDPSGLGAASDIEVTPATWRDFVSRVVEAGLREPGTGRVWPSVPLPEHARVLLAGLRTDSGSLDDFAAALERVGGRPARVTVLRRAGPLAVLAVVPALMVLVRLVVPLFLIRLPVWYQDLSLNAPAYFDSLRSAAARAGTDSIARRTADAIRVMLADDRIEAIRVPQIGKPALDNLPPRARADLDSAALRYPAPDSATVIAARAWLKGRVQMVRLNGGVSHVPDAFRQGMKALGVLGVVGVALALVLRGGLLFTLFGIALQRADGAPAGRLRCLARSLVAWAPFMVLTLVSQVNNVKVGLAQPGLSVTATSGPPAAPAPPPTRGSGLEDALIVLAVAGAGVAAFRPARGLAERIAGVVLVPK